MLVLFLCKALLEYQKDERQECLPSYLPASISPHMTDGPGHRPASILPQWPACIPRAPGSFLFWDLIHLPSALWAWLSLPQNKVPPLLHDSFKIAQDTYCAPSSHLPAAPLLRIPSSHCLPPRSAAYTTSHPKHCFSMTLFSPFLVLLPCVPRSNHPANLALSARFCLSLRHATNGRDCVGSSHFPNTWLS